MFAIKIYLHLLAAIKKIFLKTIYGNKFKIGRNVSWRRYFSIVIEGKGHIDIADNCFFNNNCSINSLGNIKIGSNSIFGENVKIYDHNHRFRDRDLPIKKQGFSIGEVIIGSNCWIGSNVTILKNTCIGNNCVISAGITLNENVPDNTIVKHKSGNYYFEKWEN